jgi:uncharacterized DUF497 family protein
MEILWDADDDEAGNVVHLQKHAVLPSEVSEVLFDPNSTTSYSRTSDRYLTFGFTLHGRYLAVVTELDGPYVRPVTAYDVPQPKRKRRKRS